MILLSHPRCFVAVRNTIDPVRATTAKFQRQSSQSEPVANNFENSAPRAFQHVLSSGRSTRDVLGPLQRINFVLWLGISNGCVQVIEIIGDDLKGVTNVSAKRALSSPVVDLLQIVDSTIWSIEGMQPSLRLQRRNSDIQRAASSGITNADDVMCRISNVAVWNIHDFTYNMSDELKDLFIVVLSIVKRILYERIAVTASGDGRRCLEGPFHIVRYIQRYLSEWRH